MKLGAFCSSVAIVVLMMTCGGAHAMDDEEARGTLRGLKGVCVAVEQLDEEAVKDGLTLDTINTDVELKLRLAGIRVLSYQEWLKEPGAPHLFVSVRVFKLKPRGGYLYNVQVALRQTVSLGRSPAVTAIGQTWDTGYVGVSPELKDVREHTKDRVDDFINAYLSVNPKK